MAEVRPEYRELLALRDIKGMRYQEISLHLGIGVKRVKWLLHNARKELQTLVEGGTAGFIAKLIVMLAVIEDPQAIYGQFVLGLEPVFYGIFCAAVILPLSNRLRMRK